MSITEYHTIEPSKTGSGFWLVSHGEYDKSSILEGKPYRGLIYYYETLEEATEANPDVEVLGHTTYNPYYQSELPSTAPGWFTSADAGEVWHENDY